MSAPDGFGDTEVKRIIDRAAEIDALQGRQLNASALRDIAAEAGISPSAVDQALEEHTRATPTLPARLLRRRGLLIGGLVLLAVLLSRL